MARMPNLPVEIRGDFVSRAREQGFFVDQLLPVEHGSLTFSHKPK
jgi:lipocalin